MALISLQEAETLRDDLSVFLVHTYTRTPRVESVTEEDDGTKELSNGTPVSGILCAYSPVALLRIESGGWTTINTPSLTVAHDDATVVGDIISNVRDAAGNVLLAGPLFVATDTPNADLGYALDRILTLVGGDPRR